MIKSHKIRIYPTKEQEDLFENQLTLQDLSIIIS